MSGDEQIRVGEADATKKAPSPKDLADGIKHLPDAVLKQLSAEQLSALQQASQILAGLEQTPMEQTAITAKSEQKPSEPLSYSKIAKHTATIFYHVFQGVRIWTGYDEPHLMKKMILGPTNRFGLRMAINFGKKDVYDNLPKGELFCYYYNDPKSGRFGLIAMGGIASESDGAHEEYQGWRAFNPTIFVVEFGSIKSGMRAADIGEAFLGDFRKDPYKAMRKLLLQPDWDNSWSNSIRQIQQPQMIGGAHTLHIARLTQPPFGDYSSDGTNDDYWNILADVQHIPINNQYAQRAKR